MTNPYPEEEVVMSPINPSANTPPSRIDSEAGLRDGAMTAGAAAEPDGFLNTKDDKSNEDAVNKLLDERIKENTPGAAIMVIRGDRVVYEGYKGMANLEKKIPIGPDTVFDLASVSKQFTAMALLILGERGRLKFDDYLTTYFPEYDWPEQARKIRISHLLNHNSGLPGYDQLFYESEGGDLDKIFGRSGVRLEPVRPRSAKAYRQYGIVEPTSEDILKLVACWKGAYLFEPGGEGRWKYSNPAYAVLACLVERVSGRSFPRFMRENIFSPLGMDSTYVYSKTADGEDRDLRARRASSYDRGWEEYHEIDYTPYNYIYGDGNVNTNLRDMVKWDQAMQVIYKSEDYPGQTPLVSEKVVREAFRTKLTTTEHKNIKYSFGWYWGRARGKHLMWHGGRWVGFRTAIMRFYTTSPRLTVIMCSNNMFLSASYLACRIARVYVKELKHEPAELKLEALRTYVANYQRELAALGKGGEDRDDITLEGERLYVKTTPDLEKRKLVPIVPTKERDVAFYIEGAEDFDVFRYDISDHNITPPSRSRRMLPRQTLCG
jgi:CubicO group peptidase (beta-lactamase class C family)